MAREKKPEEVKAGAPEWMNTYGDMVTLLLCFFVLLYAMSDVNAAKFSAIAAALSSSPTVLQTGAADGINTLLGNGIIEMPMSKTSSDSKLMNEIKQEVERMSSDFKTYFAKNNREQDVIVTETEESVVLTFPDGVLFDSGRADLKSSALSTLNMVANQLLKYPNNAIFIEGHTDTDPIGTIQYPDNWYLSGARSITVGQYFINEVGISPNRITASGRGEYLPVAPNDTPENKSKNRRVEIRVMNTFHSQSIMQ